MALLLVGRDAKATIFADWARAKTVKPVVKTSRVRARFQRNKRLVADRSAGSLFKPLWRKNNENPCLSEVHATAREIHHLTVTRPRLWDGNANGVVYA
jgi:hypothetical protein